jgi:hypothetical protein
MTSQPAAFSAARCRRRSWSMEETRSRRKARRDPILSRWSLDPLCQVYQVIQNHPNETGFGVSPRWLWLPEANFQTSISHFVHQDVGSIVSLEFAIWACRRLVIVSGASRHQPAPARHRGGARRSDRGGADHRDPEAGASGDFEAHDERHRHSAGLYDRLKAGGRVPGGGDVVACGRATTGKEVTFAPRAPGFLPAPGA